MCKRFGYCLLLLLLNKVKKKTKIDLIYGMEPNFYATTAFPLTHFVTWTNLSVNSCSVGRFLVAIEND